MTQLKKVHHPKNGFGFFFSNQTCFGCWVHMCSSVCVAMRVLNVDLYLVCFSVELFFTAAIRIHSICSIFIFASTTFFLTSSSVRSSLLAFASCVFTHFTKQHLQHSFDAILFPIKMAYIQFIYVCLCVCVCNVHMNCTFNLVLVNSLLSFFCSCLLSGGKCVRFFSFCSFHVRDSYLFLRCLFFRHFLVIVNTPNGAKCGMCASS